MKTLNLPESKLTKKQTKTKSKTYTEDGRDYKINVELRFDDECGNGHNSFAITADITHRGRFESGGCIHEEIIKHFPEYKPLIKWHLTSTDGPMHYLGNTLYLAGDKDCWGKTKGEPHHHETTYKFYMGEGFGLTEGRRIGFPIHYKPKSKAFRIFLDECLEMVRLDNRAASVFDFEVLRIDHKTEPDGYKYSPKYTWGGFQVEKWHECPFDTQRDALEVLTAFRYWEAEAVKIPTSWGEGKEPQLESARHSAVWPTATLAQLQDKKALEERLPALMRSFRDDMEGLGFTY